MSSALAAGSMPCLYPTIACLFSAIRDRDFIKSYEGYQVLRLNITTKSGFEQIKNVYLSEQYDFWSSPSMHASTDIMAPPQLAGALKTFLGIIGVPFDVIYENLQE